MRLKKVISICAPLIIIVGALAGYFINKEYNEDLSWLDSGDKDEMVIMMFNDVASNRNSAKYISYVAQREIIEPDDLGYFYPIKNISRGEFSRIVVKATLNNNYYEELKEDDYFGYVKILEDLKVLDKDEINKDNINNEITKIEVAKILARADINIRNSEQKINVITYEDIKDLDEVSVTLLAHSVKSGFVKALDIHKFNPSGKITREGAAEIIYNYLCI